MGHLWAIWLTSDNDDCAKLDRLTEVAHHICVRYQVFVCARKAAEYVTIHNIACNLGHFILRLVCNSRF
nr:MAG TPA: hypothetical protein [Caudoviricetes sp.]